MNEKSSLSTLSFGVILTVGICIGTMYLIESYFGKSIGIDITIGILGLAWFSESQASIQPKHKGVLMFLGSPRDITYSDGLHWILWPFCTLIEIDTRVKVITIGKPVLHISHSTHMLRLITGTALTPPVPAEAFLSGEIQYKVKYPSLFIKATEIDIQTILISKVESFLRGKAAQESIESFISKKSEYADLITDELTLSSGSQMSMLQQFGIDIQQVILREIVPSNTILMQQQRIKKEEIDGYVSASQTEQLKKALEIINKILPDSSSTEKKDVALRMLGLPTQDDNQTITIKGIDDSGNGEIIAALAALTKLGNKNQNGRRD